MFLNVVHRRVLVQSSSGVGHRIDCQGAASPLHPANQSLKYVPGLKAVHRMPLSGHRLASRYKPRLWYFLGSWVHGPWRKTGQWFLVLGYGQGQQLRRPIWKPISASFGLSAGCPGCGAIRRQFQTRRVVWWFVSVPDRKPVRGFFGVRMRAEK